MATFNGGLLLLLCLGLLQLSSMASATQFRVGGSMGWTVPTDPNAMSYNQWAQKNRFKIGDSLLFVYQAGGDSVLQVSQESYNTCNTSSSSYIKKFDDGNTVFVLDRSGPYYFISGVENNCLRKESLVVVVLSDRNNNLAASSPSPSMASPPSDVSSPPSPSTTTSPPPTPSEVTPSPSSNTGQGMSSSPPPPPPTKNGASYSKVVGFFGTFGAALLGSLLFL